METIIKNNFVFAVDGSGREYRLEPATNLARNEWGYEHDYTWEEVAKLGVPIWVTETGGLWCENPESYPHKFVNSMRKHGESFRRVALDPTPDDSTEAASIAAFWESRLRNRGVNNVSIAAEGRHIITVRITRNTEEEVL